MRLEFESVRDDLDELLHEARKEKRTIKKIILTQEESEQLFEELIFPRNGKNILTYQGYPIEVKNE